MSNSANGFNPLRWDCEKQGCFNKKRRPKIEIFADCFPGRVNFGDVDGIVELNGHILMLEWKSQSLNIPMGQKIMYERLTKSEKVVVLCVQGDPETMRVDGLCTFQRGIQSAVSKADLRSLKARIKAWAGTCRGIGR